MNRVERLIASPAGALVARPWFDRFTIAFFERWFFPSSRLWAAARAANGSTEAFFEQVPVTPLPHLAGRIKTLLQRFESKRSQVLTAEAQWEDVFFGANDVSGTIRATTEEQRLALRAEYNELRRRFSFISRQATVPPVRWEISSPMELAADYARVIREEFRPFAAPAAMPPVVMSRTLPGPESTDYWIRFASPSGMNDTVVARVSEPTGVTDPPTLIFLHGVGVEFDHWHGMIDEAARLVRMGIRVVRPEAPWHGRRVPDGRYGGEKFIATLPRGSLEFSSAQVREVAVLMDWCRRHTGAPIGLGGSSLGAHIARVAAARAHDWPDHLHPDALFLITPCGRLEDAAIEGSFARIWGTAEAAGEQGWSPVLRSKWLSLIDPDQPPVVPPERIVALLGEKDKVTPFASGQRLVGRLQLPEENIFRWPLGHFSIPINMVRDAAPLSRFRQVLKL
ncbi:MAG: alpha/beta hydrolase [Woeseiaceae bacterium]